MVQRRKPDREQIEAVEPSREVEHFAVPSQILRRSHSLRLDASHFNPAVAHALEMLRRSGMKLAALGDITSGVFIPPRFKRIYVERDHGIPFLQGSHVVHFQPADVKYLSTRAHKRLERWIIRSGWILVTCSGTVGRVAICPPEWDNWAASQHILRIIPDDSACSAGYLYSFLASPLGQVQLTKQIYGAVVDELTEDQTRSVLVPLPVNNEQREQVERIDHEAREAVRVRSQAVTLISRAADSIAALVHVGRTDGAYEMSEKAVLKVAEKHSPDGTMAANATTAERFDAILSRVVRVSKKDLTEREAAYRRERQAQKRRSGGKKQKT